MEAVEEVTLDRNTVSSLLNPPKTRIPILTAAEQDRPWQPSRLHTFDRPLLRLWDHWSGSRPDRDGFLRSRAPRERLDTDDLRKNSLTIHINHKSWTPTPYISFTDNPRVIRELEWKRTHYGCCRGPHNLTAIDANQRVRTGLPTLHMGDEMKHYEIGDPYGGGGANYRDEYICLWEVTDREIVGEWRWNDLAKNRNWYQDIVMPAFRARQACRAEHLPDLFAGLSLSINPINPDETIHRAPESSNRETTRVSEDDDSDEPYCSLLIKNGPDTDDEAEEANTSDDMIKILEGDW